MARLSKWILCAAVICGLTCLEAACGTTSYHNAQRSRDLEAVQTYINNKRTLSFREKQNFLKIFGDIKFETYYRNETQNGLAVRGKGATDSSGVPIERLTWDTVVNLNTAYKCSGVKGIARVQYKNSLGTDFLSKDCVSFAEGLHGSGVCNKICLKDAYVTWKMYLWNEDRDRVKLGLGRRQISKLFESRVQFYSRFDGALLKYTHKFEPSWKFWVKAGAFVVDERTDHFAYIGEVAVLDLLESNFDLKYCYVDWLKRGVNRCGTSHAEGSQYQNSQFLVAYNIDPEVLGKRTRLYGAVVLNHGAHRRARTNFKKENVAWYAAVVYGNVKKACDWSVNVAYEHVEAQSIPDRDMGGIGRGNIRRDYLLSENRGNTNYRGIHLEGLYAITDQLTLDVIVDHSRSLNSNIGGKSRYTKFEADLALAF